MSAVSDWLNSSSMKKLNPDPFALKKKVQVEPISENRSSHEEKFYDLWLLLGGPELKREFRFHEKRRWRLDFCHESSKTAIEIDGGIWVKSGHSSGTGISRDIEKSNELEYMGYRLFRFTGDMITTENLKRLMGFIAQNAVPPSISPSPSGQSPEQ